MDQSSHQKQSSLARAAAYARVAGSGACDLLKGVLTGRDGGAIVPGVSRARVIESDPDLPERVDVVVIGGGYIGCLTALELAERGVRVALCEKGVVAGEASGRSLGLIEGQLLDPAKVEIVSRSKELWAKMDARVGGETGYRCNGFAALIGDEGFLGFAEGWVESMRGTPGVDARMIDAQEAAGFATGASGSYLGGIYQPSDASIEPQLAVPAIAEGIRKAGGIVLQQCAVRGVETKAGAISGIVTERGPISCDAVVVAGGAWSPIFLRSLGLDMPQFMAFSSVARLGPAHGPSVPVLEGNRGLVIRQTINGGYDVCKARGSVPVTPQIIASLGRLAPAMRHMADQLEPVWNFATFMSQWRIPKSWDLAEPSPFEHNRILMPETRVSLLEEVLGGTGDAFPALGRAPVIDRWAGVLTSTIDNMPVISAVDGRPGLFIGSGFYFGLTMAPAAGEALADLVTGKTPRIDLSLYRHSRFGDGSEIVFRH